MLKVVWRWRPDKNISGLPRLDVSCRRAHTPYANSIGYVSGTTTVKRVEFAQGRVRSFFSARFLEIGDGKRGWHIKSIEHHHHHTTIIVIMLAIRRCVELFLKKRLTESEKLSRTKARQYQTTNQNYIVVGRLSRPDLFENTLLLVRYWAFWKKKERWKTIAHYPCANSTLSTGTQPTTLRYVIAHSRRHGYTPPLWCMPRWKPACYPATHSQASWTPSHPDGTHIYIYTYIYTYVGTCT